VLAFGSSFLEDDGIGRGNVEGFVNELGLRDVHSSSKSAAMGSCGTKVATSDRAPWRGCRGRCTAEVQVAIRLLLLRLLLVPHEDVALEGFMKKRRAFGLQPGGVIPRSRGLGGMERGRPGDEKYGGKKVEKSGHGLSEVLWPGEVVRR